MKGSSFTRSLERPLTGKWNSGADIVGTVLSGLQSKDYLLRLHLLVFKRLGEG